MSLAWADIALLIAANAFALRPRKDVACAALAAAAAEIAPSAALPATAALAARCADPASWRSDPAALAQFTAALEAAVKEQTARARPRAAPTPAHAPYRSFITMTAGADA